MPKAKNGNELVFLPLGGAGEIGMNLYLYGTGPADKRQWLMVDLGLTFGGEFEPGVDVILPDIRFIEEERSALHGIVLTHAHEDHIGAVLDLWHRLQVPVYATPFTNAMLQSKYEQYGSGAPVPVEEVATGSRFQAGPFDIEFVDMAHSIPEPSGIVIRTDAGSVFHTGDWKLDEDPVIGPPVNAKRLAEVGDEGLDVLVCDSTNVFRDGVSPSEHDVAENIIRLIKAAPKRVAVTTFASNLARIVTVAKAAKASGREVVISGRAMWRVINAGRDTGYIPDDLNFLTEDDFGYLSRDQVVLLCTGSQGEARASLARIAQQSHPRVSLTKGDLLIFSSKTIPGNEKSVGRIHNALVLAGVDVITERTELVHVSGHPRRGELKQLYDWLKPQTLVPMHGEAMHLEEHRRFARASGVPHVARPVNGLMTRLCPGPPDVIDEAPAGRTFRDARLLVPEDDHSIKERRKLGFAGVVSVSMVLGKDGDLAANPQISVVGLPSLDSQKLDEADQFVDLESQIEDAVFRVIESMPRARRKDRERVSEATRRAVRAAVNQLWGKKPICQVMVFVV